MAWRHMFRRLIQAFEIEDHEIHRPLGVRCVRVVSPPLPLPAQAENLENFVLLTFYPLPPLPTWPPKNDRNLKTAEKSRG